MTSKLPQNWPKGFCYATESIAFEIHPILLRAAYLACSSLADRERSELLLDAKQIHPHLKIYPLTKQLQYLGPSPHPLAGQKTQRGHLERGVFATMKIESSSLLGEYVGKMFLIFSQDRIRDFLQHNTSRYLWCGHVNEHIVIIDAENHANELAFVNHYKGLKDAPNAKALWVAHRGFYHFCYVAIRDIEAKEEILVDYGETFQAQL